METLKFHNHYKSLGILVKRSSCLFSTKERLRKVGQVLDMARKWKHNHIEEYLGDQKLRDAHIRICNDLGSDLAYSCYGQFLHAFVAGWELEEKSKAFIAIKGASLLEERIEKVLKSEPGKYPGYERYIRVFCREIFLDKSDSSEVAFWLAQLLKPLPMCFQSNLLFILYGPTDSETDEIQWELVTSSSNIPKIALSELGRTFRIMWSDSKGNWNADDTVTVPSEWNIECISSLLAQCGEKFCCEVLGNKAMNGRTRELAYLLYHIWQRRFTWNSKSVFGKREQSHWFVSLLRSLSNILKNEKTFNSIISQLFGIWEEFIIDGLDDLQYMSDSQTDDEDFQLRGRLQSIISLVTCLLP
eukprot:gene11340-21531_t